MLELHSPEKDIRFWEPILWYSHQDRWCVFHALSSIASTVRVHFARIVVSKINTNCVNRFACKTAVLRSTGAGRETLHKPCSLVGKRLTHISLHQLLHHNAFRGFLSDGIHIMIAVIVHSMYNDNFVAKTCFSGAPVAVSETLRHSGTIHMRNQFQHETLPEFAWDLIVARIPEGHAYSRSFYVSSRLVASESIILPRNSRWPATLSQALQSHFIMPMLPREALLVCRSEGATLRRARLTVPKTPSSAAGKTWVLISLQSALGKFRAGVTHCKCCHEATCCSSCHGLC